MGALATSDGDSVQTSPQPPEPMPLERRQSRRYRLSLPITIWLGDGSGAPAITIEISEIGLSVCTDARLTVGKLLVLDPVGSSKASAVVRRKRGSIYGFSFQSLTPDQLSEIRLMCASLPIFLSRLDI